MNAPYQPQKRSWIQKFAAAGRGVVEGSIGQSSFAVHYFFTVVVIGCGLFFRINPTEWSLLLVCIGAVLGMELMNSAVERIAKAATEQESEHVRAGLDIASGAVLIVAIAAACVGAIIFLPKFLVLVGL